MVFPYDSNFDNKILGLTDPDAIIFGSLLTVLVGFIEDYN